MVIHNGIIGKNLGLNPTRTTHPHIKKKELEEVFALICALLKHKRMFHMEGNEKINIKYFF